MSTAGLFDVFGLALGDLVLLRAGAAHGGNQTVNEESAGIDRPVLVSACRSCNYRYNTGVFLP